MLTKFTASDLGFILSQNLSPNQPIGLLYEFEKFLFYFFPHVGPQFQFT